MSNLSRFLKAQEAEEYLKNDLLRDRLVEISEALLQLESNDAGEVMGYPDDLKLRSSLTLFHEVAPETEVFQKVLDKFLKENQIRGR